MGFYPYLLDSFEKTNVNEGPETPIK